MPSSATPALRLEKQATGENLNSWGNRLNQVIDLVEDALTGRVAVSGNMTLSSANYVADEARKLFLDASATATVTVPQVGKFYLVRAGGGDVTVTTGAGGGAVNAVVKSGNLEVVVSDGTNVRPVRLTDFGTTVPKSATNPTLPEHLARKAYVDAGTTAALNDAKAYTDLTAFTAAGGNLPAQSTNAGKVLGTNGSVSSWTDPNGWTQVTANGALALRGSYLVDTTAARALTLPASPGDGAQITVADGLGQAGTNNITLTPAGGETIDGDASFVIDLDRGVVRLVAVAGGWRVAV